MTPEHGELQRRIEFQIGERKALGDYLQPANNGKYAFLPIPIFVEGVGEGEISFPLFDPNEEPLSQDHVVSTPYGPIMSRLITYNAPPQIDPASLPFMVELSLPEISSEDDNILMQLFANGKTFEGDNDVVPLPDLANKSALGVIGWYENEEDTLLLFPQNSDAKKIELQFG